MVAIAWLACITSVSVGFPGKKGFMETLATQAMAWPVIVYVSVLFLQTLFRTVNYKRVPSKTKQTDFPILWNV